MSVSMEWESQHASGPSTPNSISSQSTGNNNPVRGDKMPAVKQLSPSPSVSTLSKLSDDDIRRKGKEDLLVMLRRMEADYRAVLGDHGNMVKDVNRLHQSFILENRNLKEVNQRLQDDNQELRDLCCFLDDDRQVGRKLAREWQRFGRYTASVMRSEVAVYQEKLRELEQGQTDLVTENMELKELCLFLDQERSRIAGDRDEGDGSSNGTTTGHEDGIMSTETNVPTQTNITPITTGSSNYLRELEQKVLKLEEEKRILAQRISRTDGSDYCHVSSNDNTLIQDNGMDGELLHGSGLMHRSKTLDTKKPDAVMHAMKVLQVHEDLEKLPAKDDNWDDSEKAILREMCNVVWRKLGDVGDVGSFNESTDSILDPPPPIPHSGMAPGMQGQSQSFSLPQPQPQMASTPLSSATKMSSSMHPINPSSASQAQYPAQQKKAWLPQADQRVDIFSTKPKDQIVTAEVRPVSPAKKREVDRMLPSDYDRDRTRHNNYDRQPKPNQASSVSSPQAGHQDLHPPQPYPGTQRHYQSSSNPEDENIPPHFLPHSRHHPVQYSGPQQQPVQQPPSQRQYPQTKYGHPPQPQQPVYANARKKTFTSPGHDMPSQSHNGVGNVSSSVPATAPTHSKTPSYSSYSNQPPLTSSQQYPHHPVRLLDAPGVRQAPAKYEPRTMSKDDYYSSQKLQKPHGHHPQMMYQKRDDTRSEPNISQAGKGNDNAVPADSQIRGSSSRHASEAGYGQKQDHFSSTSHGRYASDSSHSHQALSFFQPPRSGGSHYQDSAPSHHQTAGVGHTGGHNAYPPSSAAISQLPPSRQNQPLQKTPVMARSHPHRINAGMGKPVLRNAPHLNHYKDYDSDSL